MSTISIVIDTVHCYSISSFSSVVLHIVICFYILQYIRFSFSRVVFLLVLGLIKQHVEFQPDVPGAGSFRIA